MSDPHNTTPGELIARAQEANQEAMLRQRRELNGRTVELLPCQPGSMLAEMMALGFELDLSAEGADNLLVPMYLPPGWERRTSDHPMYTYLVDGNGADRVQVMYKGAVYDRDGWMRIL
jgi:hypothetical protein